MLRDRPTLICLVMLVVLSACAAPATVDLPQPTATAPSPPTPTATLGPREYIDALYCWPSPVDAGSYNLIRFFPDGHVLDVGVQPFANCDLAWQSMQTYLTLENLLTFSHGEYVLSGETLRYELAAKGSSTVIAEVTGTYLGSKLILLKGGATQEYARVALNP